MICPVSSTCANKCLIRAQKCYRPTVDCMYISSGLKFWKVGSRKIFAVQLDGKQRLSHKKVSISDSDSEVDFEPVKKKHRLDSTSLTHNYCIRHQGYAKRSSVSSKYQRVLNCLSLYTDSCKTHSSAI